MHKDRGNGANVVVQNDKKEILVVRQNYGLKRWILPGGEVERGESPTHAVQEETWEETGIVLDENNLKLVAYFVQRPSGIVFLYETSIFSGSVIIEPTEEILEVAWMSFDEIIRREEQFLLGYRRMILRHKRCELGIDKTPYSGRLSDPVEFPRNITGDEYRKFVISV